MSGPGLLALARATPAGRTSRAQVGKVDSLGLLLSSLHRQHMRLITTGMCHPARVGSMGFGTWGAVEQLRVSAVRNGLFPLIKMDIIDHGVPCHVAWQQTAGADVTPQPVTLAGDQPHTPRPYNHPHLCLDSSMEELRAAARHHISCPETRTSDFIFADFRVLFGMCSHPSSRGFLTSVEPFSRTRFRTVIGLL